MKRILYFIPLLILVSMRGQNYCTKISLPGPLQTSVVAYYSFCGNTNDMSGNNNHATGTNVSLTTDRFGNSNSAYLFNGTNSAVSSTVACFDNSWNNYSISFWMNTSNSSKIYQSCFNTLPHNIAQIAYNFPGPQTNFVHFSLNSNPASPGWNMVQYSQGTYSTYVNNQWYHIALTKNGTVWKFYVNGALDNVFSDATPITSSLTNVIIGAIINPTTSLSDQHFQGKLDDILIYNRTLNSVEVASLTCLNPSDAGPITGAILACTGVQGTYSVAPINGVTSYSWVTPGNWTGTSTTNVINCTPGFSGVFQLEGVNSCGKSSAVTLSILVNSVPNVTAAISSPTICSGQSATLSAGGASTYVWIPGNVSGQNPIVSPTVTTNYTVTGTLNGCSDTAVVTQSVVICAGLNENTAEHYFDIFPNPSTGKLTIKVDVGTYDHILVIDMLGKEILRIGQPQKEQVIELNQQGIYILQLFGQEHDLQFTKKIVIE